MIRTIGLLCAALIVLTGGGCGDEVRGELRLLVVPLHRGRAPIQDPFSLVDRVEIGLTATDGSYRSLGKQAPLSRFGPGLVGALGAGAATLTGLNDRDRPVSRGYGAPVSVEPGLDAFISVAFARVDHAVARRLRAIDAGQATPFQGLPPALRLDAANLEQGQLGGDGDAGCLAWVAWTDAGLSFLVRVIDDDVAPSGIGSPADGDAVVLYLDLDGDPAVAPGEEIVVTIGADGRVEPDGVLTDVEAKTVAGGYELVARLPGGGWEKNQELGLDLRVIDASDVGATLLTWVFDPRSQGADPSAEQYGRLILGVPLMDLVGRAGPRLPISLPEGVVEVTGRWDGAGLWLQLAVPDDEVRPSGPAGGLDQADRLAIWLDLGNGEAATEPKRFHRLTISAGGSLELAAGPDPGNVTDLGSAFSGQVTATTQANGYSVEVFWPWEDLQLDEQPQRGWFLGLEIEIYDEDADGLELHTLSDGVGQPGLWSELRLFAVE